MRVYAKLRPQLLLEKAIIEYRLHKDISILKYALQAMRGKCFNKAEWKKIEPLLFNIWIRLPSLSKIATMIFKNNEAHLSSSFMKKAIYTILDTNIPLNNDEEVIWAVWLCKVFSVKLSQNYIKQVLDTENWIAIIILLEMISPRKTESAIKDLINKFRKRIVDEYFSDDDVTKGMLTDIWLLAYEADKNKWLNTSGVDTFLFARKHPFFKELRDHNIDFYNSSYTYAAISNQKAKHKTYVTRQELIELFKEFRSAIATNQLEESSSSIIIKLEKSIYDEVTASFENAEDY